LNLILDEIENGGPAVMIKYLFLKSYFIVLAFPYFHHKLLWCKLVNNLWSDYFLADTGMIRIF